MKSIDPIKNMSARELAEKMLDDLKDTMSEYEAELNRTGSNCIDDISKICSKMVKYDFAIKFIEEYIAPIELTLMQEYNSLKTKDERDSFIRTRFTYVDPFEILASGLLTKDNECTVFGVTPPGTAGMYELWSIIEVGSDYVKIMPERPIPYVGRYGTRKVKTPVVIIGVGMDFNEVQQQIYWAYSD